MSETSGQKLSPKINEQCFLIEKAEDIYKSLQLSAWTTGIVHATGKAVRQLGDAGGVLGDFDTNLKYINALTKAQNSKSFFEISPAEKAQLSHYATINVVKKPQKGNKKTRFPVFTESAFRDGFNDDMFKSEGKRTGAGIVSLDIDHQGIDSATEKVGLVNAKFIFQDIRTMLSQPYVELFKVGPSETNKDGEKVFRTIEFELGWNAEKSLAARLNLEAIKLKLKTHLVKYTFDLNQDGSLTVNAQYMGQITNTFDGPNSNILALAKAEYQEVKNNQEEMIKMAEASANEAAKKARHARINSIVATLIAKTLKEKAEGVIEFETTGHDNKVKKHEIIPSGESSFGRFIADLPRNDQSSPLAGAGMGYVSGISDPAPANNKRTWEDVLQSDTLTKVGKLGAMGSAKEQLRDVTQQAFALIGKQAKEEIKVLELEGDYDELEKAIDKRIAAIRKTWSSKIGISGTDSQGNVTTAWEIGRYSSEQVEGLLEEYLGPVTVDKNGKMKIGERLTQYDQDLENAKTKAQQTLKDAKTQATHAIDKAQQELLAQAMLAKFLALQQIGAMLFANNSITTGYIPKQSAMDYRLAVAAKSKAGIASTIDKIRPQDFLKKRDLTLDDLSKEEFQVVPFVFLGQLMETILALPTDQDKGGNYTGSVYELMQQSSGEDPTIDFGYINYQTPFSGKSIKNYPLYYLPISLKKINDFFAREVVAKELQFFSLKDFLLRLLKMFFTNMFQVCASDANNVVNFVPPKLQRLVGQDDNDMHYFIYGAKSAAEDIKRGKIKFGNYQSNYDHKIYHFFFGGQAKGAVLNVKVTDVADDTTKRAVYFSSRASAEAEDSGAMAKKGGTLMPVTFQADIETIGFPLFNIGQLIYVDLRPYIKEKDSRIFKSNGYYGVYKISHKFSATSFTSHVTALIQISKASQDKASGPAATPVNESDISDISIAIDKIEGQSELEKKHSEMIETGKLDGETPEKLTDVQIKENRIIKKNEDKAKDYEKEHKDDPELAKIMFLFQQGPKAYTDAYGEKALEDTQGKLLQHLKKKTGSDEKGNEVFKEQYLKLYYPDFVSYD